MNCTLLILALVLPFTMGCAKFKSANRSSNSKIQAASNVKSPPIWNLPKPDEQLTPMGPLEFGWNSSPGGSGFPFLYELTASKVPAIGFHTDTAFSDETIAVIGENLKDAKFVMWAEGITFPLQAIRTDTDRAQIAIPDHTSVSVPNSVMFLWPHNSNGYGLPVKLNAPEIFWVWPGKKWTGEHKNPIRIFGKNLALISKKEPIGKEPLVVAWNGADAPFKLEVVSYAANEVQAKLPEGYTVGYPSGNYKVWVHNQTGGQYGWSEAGSFEVAVNSYHVSTHYYVEAEVGTDNEKINKAITKASVNGGTVEFSNRTYILTENIDVSQYGDKPIILNGKGAGPRGTIIKALGTASSPERFINLFRAGSGMKNMRLEGVHVNTRAKDINIDNIDATANNHPISNGGYVMEGGEHDRQNINLNVTNSTFRAVNAGAYVGWASFVRFFNCHFIGLYKDGVYDESGNKVYTIDLNGNIIYNTNHDNHGISFRNSHNVIVENSTFEGYVPPESNNPLDRRLLTRAIGTLTGTESNHVYSKNTMKNIGAFPSSPARDRNTGEVIMFHGSGRTGVASVVHSADLENIIVNRSSWIFNQYDFATNSNGRAIELGLLRVMIVSGSAAGQVLLLKSAKPKPDDPSKTVLNVSRLKNIYPKAGDKVIVQPMFYQNLILNNTIDAYPNRIEPVDFLRIGILFYAPAHNSVIFKNNIQHVTEGIHIQSAQRAWVQGANLIHENTFLNHVSGAQDSMYTKCYAEAGGAQVEGQGYFYGVGNVFRNNTCANAEMGVSLGAGDHDNIVYLRNDSIYQVSADSGIVHSIIENNTFIDTGSLAHPASPTYPNYAYFSMGAGTPAHPNLAVAITLTANWPLIRNNIFPAPHGGIDYYLPKKIHEPLVIQTK